jgi:transposase
MDQVHVVRHKVLVEGRSGRAVAKELGIARETVRKYLREALPSRQEVEPRERPVWEKVGPRVEALLAESVRWTGGKQRLTATRLHELLRGEGHAVGVTVVKEAVAEWKRQRREVMIPLTYRAGDLAEVDFFEVLVDLAGQRRKAWLFVLRLMYSGRDFGWIYERQDQISFLDGHARAFAHLDGVPARIAYDNPHRRAHRRDTRRPSRRRVLNTGRAERRTSDARGRREENAGLENRRWGLSGSDGRIVLVGLLRA